MYNNVKLLSKTEHKESKYLDSLDLFKDIKTRQKVEVTLLKRSILARRYFSPSLDTLDYLENKQYMPISRDISERILCLPIYPNLDIIDQDIIINIIKDII